MHHNIWLILLLPLPNQDIILGQGMQLCWHQPIHGAYLHLVTEPFSRQLPNCGTFFRRRSETFRASHLLKRALKTYFFKIAFYYINTNEIPGEISRENMISSHVKISPLPWLHNKSRLSQEKTVSLKWFGISLVFI